MASLSQEFTRGWRVVTGAALGVGVGISGLLTYNSGLFVEGLQRDVGLSRTVYGAAFLGATLALALAMPWVARAVDRYGPRTTAAAGSFALALGFIGLSQVHAAATYVVVMIAIGLFGSLSSPVPYTRAVAATFESARGLALGVTQMGIGVAAALIPPLVGLLISQQGWRAGFMALGAVALLGTLPALLLLPRHVGRGLGAAPAQAFAAVRKTSVYRLQLLAFTTMALAFAGLLAHFVPLLRDSGMAVAQAGALAGLMGLSVIVSRVLVGWLSDLIKPSALGAISCGICAGGCIVLAIGGPSQAPVAALALGVAMGAEADLIGILTARHFPLAAFSRAYAAQYAAFMVAAGASPLWIGYLADATGNYDLALYISAAALMVPVAVFIRLTAYPDAATLNEQVATRDHPGSLAHAVEAEADGGTR